MSRATNYTSASPGFTLIAPFLIVGGVIEFFIRMVFVIVLVISILGLIVLDEYGDLIINPVCFKVLERIYCA